MSAIRMTEMRGTARTASIHGVLWSSDSWYRWSWYVGPAALALLIAGWICVDKPNGGASSAASPARPFPVPGPTTTANTNVSLQSRVQDTINRCFSNDDSTVSSQACTNLITTGQIRGQQLTQAYVRLGFLQRETEPDRAMIEYDNALKVQPSADALAGRAWIYMNRGQYDLATAALNKAIELLPQPATAATVRFYRGYAFLKLENYPQALTDLNEAIKLKPNNADFYLARGEVLQGLESNDAALRDFDEFSKLAPKDSRGLVSRGAVLEAMGRPQDALAALESAIALAPGNSF